MPLENLSSLLIVTVRDVTSGVQFTSTITEVGLIDFYRTPVAEDKHTYIVAHGTDAPTSPQSTLIYYIKRYLYKFHVY